MRKRQWKKILSVVLALAMVFSMNITAFADEVADPAAVEQPAAEQPAETPAAEEPAPADETTPAAEEPAAPADETPVAEQPAPADETPAQDAEGSAGGESEDPAGAGDTLPAGIKVVYGNGTVADTSEYRYSANTNTLEVLQHGLYISSTANDGKSNTIVIGNNNKYGVYLFANNYAFVGDGVEATPNDEDSLRKGTTLTIINKTNATAADLFVADNIKAENRVADGFASATLYDSNMDPASYDGGNASAAGYYAMKDSKLYTSNAFTHSEKYDPPERVVFVSENGTLKLTNEVTGEELNDLQYIIKKGDRTKPGRDAVSGDKIGKANGVSKVLPHQGNGEYYAWVRVSENKAAHQFSSDWVKTSPASVTVRATVSDNIDGVLTVSGLKFVAKEGGSVSYEADSDGIYTVKIQGEVEVRKDSAINPVSINVAAGATLDVDSSVNNGTNVSVTGSGTVLFNGPLNTEFDSFAAGIKIGAGEDVADGKGVVCLISGGSITTNKYKLFVKGEDEPSTVGGTELKVLSVTASNESKNSYILNVTGEFIDLNSGSAKAILSENESEFISGTVNKMVISESAIHNVSVKIGSGRTLLANNTTPIAFYFVDVPGRFTNAFPAGIYEGMERTDGIYIKNGSDAQKKLASSYEFILSTNNTATKAQIESWTGWEIGTSNPVRAVANGGYASSGKTYYLYGRKKANNDADDFGLHSDAAVIGQFTTLGKTSISINLAPGKSISPNYAGDVDQLTAKEQLAFFKAQSEKVLNSSFFSWTFNYPKKNLQVVENDNYKDNVLYVKEDGYKVGSLILHVYPWITDHFDWTSEVTTKNLYNLTPGKYAVSAQFSNTAHENVGTKYDDMPVGESNHVSFNVIKAPVKYEAKVESPAISGNITPPTLKATNQITGAPVDDTLTGVQFLYNGKTEDLATLKVGTYKVTVSQGALADDGSTRYFTSMKDTANTNYKTETELVVVAKDGLTVTGTSKGVFYGASVNAVKDSVVPVFSLGGTDVTDRFADDFRKYVKVLEAPSSNVAAATAITEEKMKTVSAGQSVYAYIIDAPIGTAKASSNAIEVKIKKRPINLSYDEKGDGTVTWVEEYRNAAKPKSAVSASKITGTVFDPGNDYQLTPKQIAGTTLFDMSAGPDVSLDLSLVKMSIPGAYTASYKNYALSSDFVENYQISDNTVNYEVLARYYVKYILEYNGKKWVSSNVVDEDEIDSGVAMKIKPTDYKTVSWGSADGKDAGVLGDVNRITKWRYQNLENNDTGDIPAEGYVWVKPNDYVVYAIVTAVASKIGDDAAVMVESLTPVTYDGTNHVFLHDEKANKKGDLGPLVIYDKKEFKNNGTDNSYMSEGDPQYDDYKNMIKTNDFYLVVDNTADGSVDEWRKYLVEGTDYTATYKNNKNASVAYNPSVSGDSADSGKNGEDATFRQLFTEKKRPQVVVKGKGNYKSLKATVYFDILPDEVDFADIPNVSDFYAPNKTLKVTPKPYDWIWTNYQKDKDKKYILKEGKYNDKKGAYTKDFVKEIYKVTRNDAGVEVKRDLVTNFKKIAAGEYVAVVKYTNNYSGTDESYFEVKTTYLLDKQTFKFAKTKPWASTPLTVADFNVTAKDKKKKAAIEILSNADGLANVKPGIYVSNIDKKVGKDSWVNVGNDETYKFKDAGVYRVTYTSNGKLLDTNSIVGSKTIQITVKGTKIKASDFKIVKMEFTGEPVAAKVELKKPNKFKTDENSKIPLADTAYVTKAGDEDDAVDNYNTDGADWVDGYYDEGTTPKATFVKKGLYSVLPVANNADLDGHNIYIQPSGRFYTEDGNNGWIKLTYNYSKVNLKKAASLITIVNNKEVEANIGGTPANFEIMAKGDNTHAGGGEYRISDNKIIKSMWGVKAGQTARFQIYDTLFDVTFKNNKKTGTAKAVIKPNNNAYAKARFTGSITVPYTIVDKKVETIGMYNADALGEPGAVVADITDAVEPKGNKSPKPVVNLYQVTVDGKKVTKLKNKTDFAWTVGKTVSGEGIHINATAPTKGSFSFIDKDHATGGATLDAGYFNTFGAKSKVKATLSQGSGSGYDASKKGYTYTGKSVEPKVTSITYGGQTYNFPAGISESSNFVVKYDKNVEVGTATATITIKKNATKGISANQAYPYGGTVKVKFKIVPQTNQNLILNK